MIAEPVLYGARRYWHGPNEQFSHGTRSVSLRNRSVWRVKPNTANRVFLGRNMPESNTSTREGKGSLRVCFINSSKRGCSATSHSAYPGL